MAVHSNKPINLKRKIVLLVCDECGDEFGAKIKSAKRCYICAKQRHLAQARANVRAWAKANPGPRKQQVLKSRDKDNARRSERYRSNPDAAKARAREYYWQNRDRILARMATDEGRAYAAARMRRKAATDPQFRLHSNVSRAIRSGLNNKRGCRWEKLVGYTVDDLRVHLERQFTRAMGWHNYGRGAGKWHIDHIVPQSAFSFTSPGDPDFRACWALTNLRPMWGAENISKHASREYLL